MTAMLIGPQIRAARALLDWSAKDLADRAGVSMRTVIRAERTSGVPRMMTDTLDAIQLTLEQAGVIFLDANHHAGPGVRFRGP